jgi:hypothetical protein
MTIAGKLGRLPRWVLPAAIMVVVLEVVVLSAIRRKLSRDAVARLDTEQADMRRLSLAMLQYVEDHQERFPSAESWLSDIAAYGLAKNPRGEGGRSKYRGICFNREVAGRSMDAISAPQDAILFFQSEAEMDGGTADPESIPRSSPTGIFAIAFADGHGYPRGVGGRDHLIEFSRRALRAAPAPRSSR